MKEDILDHGWWTPIPGFSKYEVSRTGDVRRVCENGARRAISPFQKTHRKDIFRNRRFIHITNDDGERKELPLHRTVYTAFRGAPPDGLCVYHINGDVSDNRLDNLGVIERSELCRISGGQSSRAKPVMKIDENGEVVQFYRSARQAAKDNYMSYESILDRCHHRVKNEYALTGFTFRFEQ